MLDIFIHIFLLIFYPEWELMTGALAMPQECHCDAVTPQWQMCLSDGKQLPQRWKRNASAMAIVFHR